MERHSRILFTKVRDVKAPDRANRHDAGADFFLPVIDKRFIQDLMTKNPHINHWSHIVSIDHTRIKVPAHTRLLIPSGIKVIINEKDSALVAFEKSGLAANKGIQVMAKVVDSDYPQEVHLSVINSSDIDWVIFAGDKVTQFIHMPVYLSEFEEISEEDYQKYSENYDRQGGFGSTGK